MFFQRIFTACLLVLLFAALVNPPAGALAAAGSAVQVAAAAPTATPALSAQSVMPQGSISSWHVSAALNQHRYMHAMAAWQNVLYVMGGTDTTLCQGDFEYAVIQKDGILSPWSPVALPPADQAAALELTRCFFKAITAGSNLYLLGGVNPQNTATRSVTRAAIQPWGGLSSWQADEALPDPRTGFGAAAANGYIYIAGGLIGTTSSPQNSVLYAHILPDGSLDTWSVTEPLRTARNGLELVAVDGYLYAIGGNAGSGSVVTVEFAQIKADGSLARWQSASALNTARTYFAAASDGEYIYVMGGAVKPGSTSSSSVEYARVNKDHSLTRWRATQNLLQEKIGPAAVAVNGYLYVTGGMAYDNPFHTTEYAQAIGSGPALTATALSSPTPTATQPPTATSTITLTPTVTPTATATATFDPFLIYTQAAQTVEAAAVLTAVAQTAQAQTASARTDTPTPTATLAPTDTATLNPSQTPAPTETVTPPPSPTPTPQPTAVAGEQTHKTGFYGWLGVAGAAALAVFLFLRRKFRGRQLVINLGAGHRRRPPTPNP